MSRSNRSKMPTFNSRPRLPEEARNKISSGGGHRSKKAHHRATEKHEMQKLVR